MWNDNRLLTNFVKAGEDEIESHARRRLLTASIAAAIVSTLGPIDAQALDWQPGSLPGSGSRQRIIVVGAGLAGLTAAMELNRAGHDVTVLEAQTRAGGRVRTLRSSFDDGLYAEAGAARIPETHELTLRYADEFGLELAAFRPGGVPSTVRVDGTNYRSDDDRLLRVLGCTDEEQAMGPGAILRAAFGRGSDALGSLCDTPWPPDTALRFDELSGREVLQSLGVSDGFIRYLDLGFGVLGELSGLDLLV